MKKRMFALLLCLALCVSLLPVTARADGVVYTVTLDPGEGTGEPAVFRSDEGEIADDFHSAGDCQFFRDGDGLGFCLPRAVFSEWSWAAPEGCVFNDWLNGGRYNTLSSLNTTFTAGWRKDVSGEASLTLIPDTVALSPADFDEDGFAAVTLQANVDFGPNTTGNPDVFFCIVNDYLRSGSQRIPYGAANTKAEYEDDESANFTIYHSGQALSFVVRIDPQVLIAAGPGTYTNVITRTLEWAGLDPGVTALNNITLTLTLTIPEPSYAVTVYGGTADKASAAAGESVTVTANAPAYGKQFKEWDGAEGLTFTSGSASSATATFTMPDHAVELTATYEDLVVPTYTLVVPGSVTVAPNASTAAVTVNVTELSMVTNPDGKTPVFLRLAFNSPTLRAASGETISCQLRKGASDTPSNQKLFNVYENGSYSFEIVIPSTVWDSALPGTYTGTIRYTAEWRYSNNTWSGDLETGTIPVTLTVPDPAATSMLTIDDKTNGKAVCSLAEGSYSGEQSFTVAADQAVLVAVKDGGTYTALPCTTDADGMHHYTVLVDRPRELVLVFKGDANLDSKVTGRDATLCKQVIAGTVINGSKVVFTDPLQLMAVDRDGDGVLKSREATFISQAVAGTMVNGSVCAYEW